MFQVDLPEKLGLLSVFFLRADAVSSKKGPMWSAPEERAGAEISPRKSHSLGMSITRSPAKSSISTKPGWIEKRDLS